MVLAAFALTAVMGMSGLAVEVGNGYYAKVRNQRVSDMAALGAAMSYQANNSVSQATQTAKDIVAASGLPASSATVTLPVTVGGVSGVQVQITTTVPIRLASMITRAASYDVSTTAVASLSGNTSPACVLSLSKTASFGVRIQGASTLNTTGCAVTSNSAVSVEGSSNLTASTITGPSITASGSSVINGTKAIGSNATDPLASSSALSAAFVQLGVTTTPTTVAMPTAPTISASSTNWSFPANQGAYNALAANDPVKTNCTISGQAFTCNQGTYAINNFTLPSGMTVTFTGVSVVNVYGTFSANGATLNGTQTSYNLRSPYSTGWASSPTFGNIASLYVGGAVSYSGSGNKIGSGNVFIAGGLTIGGSSSLTIGAGTHAIGGTIDVGGSSSLTVGAGDLTANGSIYVEGSATATFGNGNYVVGKDSNGYSIDLVGPTLTFGTGDFSGTGGVYVNGSSTLTMGNGDLTLGAANDGNAMNVSGSSTFYMGSGDLSADGNIVTGGSSQISFGAGQHAIDGNLTINGGGTMGAGRYTINGNFYKSASMGVTANSVTIIAAGSFYTGGASSLTLTAPAADSATNGGIVGIAFASKTTSASTIDGSSSNTLGGIFYLPNSDLSITGAGSVAAPTCFALIAKTVGITGSAMLRDTNCTAPTLTTNTSVALIQ